MKLVSPSLLFGLCALVAGAPACGAPAEGDAGARPDVLVILVDDLSELDLDAKLETPVLDRLAQGGVRFRSAYAHPSCSPSRYALLFGQYGFRGGVGGTIRPDQEAELDVGHESLPTLLGREGYHTALVGKWHLSSGNQVKRIQADVRQAGFDTWRAGMGFGDSYYGWTRIDDGRVSEEERYATDVQTDAFRDWWTGTAAPRFCLLAYQSLHVPLEKPPSGGRGYGPDGPGRWQAMGAHLDGAIGRALEVVDAERTLVFVVADNGSSPDVGLYPAEHGKPTLYEGGIAVPLIVSGPGVSVGREAHDLVGMVDLAATILELVGLEAPRGWFQDSLSFVPVLEGGTGSRRLVYTQRYRPNGFGERMFEDEAVVSEAGLKLIRFRDGSEVAYDVLLDPLEEEPLEPTAEDLATLRSVLDELGG